MGSASPVEGILRSRGAVGTESVAFAPRGSANKTPGSGSRAQYCTPPRQLSDLVEHGDVPDEC